MWWASECSAETKRQRAGWPNLEITENAVGGNHSAMSITKLSVDSNRRAALGRRIGHWVGALGCALVCGCSATEEPPEPACGDGNVDEGEECDDGNVANGDPGNDMPAVMQCLDATFTLTGPGGTREKIGHAPAQACPAKK